MAYKKGAKEAMHNRPPPPAHKEPDIYDGTPWSEEDIADLKSEWESGSTLEELCTFLCRLDWGPANVPSWDWTSDGKCNGGRL